MINYQIRPIKSSEFGVLKEFLYEAIFQPDEAKLLPIDVVDNPELKIYYEGFGEESDLCLVADVDGKIVGAVWTRILNGEIKGFGNVDDITPEFSISIYKKFRKMGIGKALMNNMLALLKEKGYKRASLSVQKKNYAANMYKEMGFHAIKETSEEYIMVCELNNLRI